MYRVTNELARSLDHVEPGDRIAQIMVEKIETIAWQAVDELR